jgi:hypothetical protein
MAGCSGSVPWSARDGSCGVGYRPCSAQEWVNWHGNSTPNYNYWTSDDLKYDPSGADNNCAVGLAYTGTCSCCSNMPMLVCKTTQPDSLNNQCYIQGCGLNNTTNQNFGGCAANMAAGVLCCPAPACADGTNEDIFVPGMVGCSGAVTYPEKHTLCAAGWTPCTAAQYVARRNNVVPTHNYWTSDLLRYNGSGSNACSVSKTVGSDCGSTTPMRVCKPTQPDTVAGVNNQCNWTSCGMETQTPIEYFGGCAGNTTAGTLCCK